MVTIISSEGAKHKCEARLDASERAFHFFKWKEWKAKFAKDENKADE